MRQFYFDSFKLLFFLFCPAFLFAQEVLTGKTINEATGEVVQDGLTGRLVPVGDAAALTNALDALLADPGATEAMGRAASEDIASRWNWEHFINDVMTIYNQVVPRSAA